MALGLLVSAISLGVPAGAGAAVTACPAPVIAGATATVTCSFTGDAQSWTVPVGVTAATFDVFGASGGAVDGVAPGLGGESLATLPVSAGQAYQVMAGGRGGDIDGNFTLVTTPPARGGFNGGGDSDRAGGSGAGGGGASDVRRNGACAQTGSCGLADRLIVAGGGGGEGTDVYNSPVVGGGGSGGGVAGGDGTASSGGGAGGGGATQTMGGAGAPASAPSHGFAAPAAAAGSLGQGGAGSQFEFGGGGGGGGLYGGGGGGGAVVVGGGSGGGGGGSGLVPPGYRTVSGTHSGYGVVIITFTAPARPVISGSPVDGSTLYASRPTPSGRAPYVFTYQWLDCNPDGTGCVANGAPSSSGGLRLTPADEGRAIEVAVTETDSLGAVYGPVTSALVGPVQAAPPVSTSPPAISGSTADGSVLSAGHGTWSGAPATSYTYQWQSCLSGSCVNVGTNQAGYRLAPSDVGRTIEVLVSETNPDGTAGPVASGTVGPVTASPPVNTAPPVIAGTPAPGNRVTGSAGTWTGVMPIAYAYQWQRCPAGTPASCANIAGATVNSYRLIPADTHVRLVVSATNPDGGPVSATSAIVP